MDSDREASCTPPLPMTEDLLPEQLSKFHSPMVPEDEHEERPLSSPATKTVPDASCVASVPEDGRKRCPDGSDRKSKEEGGKREKISDDSTPRRQSSKEAPSNEKHKSDGKHGGSSKAKSEKHKNASQERDKGKERHHRSRNHHRRKTRSRSKESTSLTKGSPGRPKQASEEDGSRKQRKESRRSNDEERKKKSKSRRRSSRSAEATGNNEERHRGHSRSHSRSRSRRRESVRRDRRSSSPARDSRPRRGDFRDGPVGQQTSGSHFKRDFNFPGRRGFHAFQRGGRFQGFPRRGSPFWMRPGPTRAPGATLSAMKYTKTLPTVSWRNWTEPLEPANSADRSPVRKIRPITPAIAALQEYDGSEDEATSNSDAEAKLNDGGEQGGKFHDAKIVGTPPMKHDGGEEVVVRHIKLEKLDERDYAGEEGMVGEMKFDCSIVKKEPLTEEDEESPTENATAAKVEEKVMVPCPSVNNAPAKPKFSCSYLEDLSSGALMLNSELLASPERQESGDEAPEPEEVEERAARGASESPDTDDYAANWETEETLSTSPSKQNLEDASPRRESVGGTPPTSHKPDQPLPEDATNGSVEQNGEEKRAHLKPRSMHEEIIPLDDLLNMQNQLKSYKSKLEEAEKLKAASLKRTDGKSPSEPNAREGLFADKLADEYQNFMQSLAQTPASGEACRKRKRSSSTSSSSSSSSSSSDSSSDSSSSSASSSSSSSSTSDSDDDHSSAEEEDDTNAERKNENSVPTKTERNENDPAVAAGASEEKPADSGTPPQRPNLFIPEYLLPKVPTPPSPTGPPTQQTPTKIYSIRDDSVASESTDAKVSTIKPLELVSTIKPLELDRETSIKLQLPSRSRTLPVDEQNSSNKIYSIRNDFVANEGTDAKVSTIKPLELDRETPIKLQLPSKSRMLPGGGASALLGQDDEEGTRPPSEPAGEHEQKPPKDRRRSSEEKSSRHRQKRSRDRHDRKRSDSRQRSRDRQTSGASSPKRKSRDRDKRSSRKERSSPSRKERSSQRHGSRSPRRRTRSPRGRRRSVSKSRSRSRSRYHSLSPSQRRPPSPRGGRSPVDHRRAGRSRRRYSVDREWNTRRSRSPYGSRRPPSPKDAPPMGHGSENQIDIITSTGASPNVHSPVTGYKKSLADSTISDAELESQKRKLIGYGGGAYYGPLPTDGMHLDPGAVPGASASADGGDESSPKRISLDDRINIVLGMNGTVDGGKSGGKHHHGHGQHLHHHHHHHHAPYGTEYPPSHDMYQQRNHHPASGNYPLPGYGTGQEQYGGSPYGAYGSRGPPTSLPPNASVATPPPYYPGSGRGPPPSWAPRSHPYQGYPMAFAAPPHHRPLLPGEMYRFPFAPPTAVPPASSGASDGTANAKSQVKQVGNVLEIVPSSAPLSAAPGSDGTLAGSTHLTSSAADGSHPGLAGSANGSSTTSPAEAATLGDTAQQQSSTGSSALVTPKILTAEELQQRHDRRLELKKKIRAEREKKRLDKKQRKERLQQDIKRLMGPKAPSGGTIDPLLDDGAAGGGGLGVGGERGGSGGGGGSASSDEEFETIKQADLLASLGRSYEKSILKVPKPPNAAGSGTVVKKSVLFADGMAPGDKSSSSADEAKEKSPNKQSVAKQRKKLRRQRTLKISGKKRLIDRMKLPELEQEPEEIDPELENLPPPPPPPGSPPPELQQPRCLNPPVVRMIDFREGFHGIGLPLPVPPVTMGGPPPPIHLVGANAMGPAGASSIPLPVPPVSMSVPPGPVPAPVPGYRQPPAMPQPHHHHLLPSHLATQRPTSPHGSVHAPLHHTHPPPHLFHHPPHIGHGSLHAPPPQHAYHQHHHHHHPLPPPQTALPPPSASASALITISSKKRTATANGSNSTGVNAIESIVSTAAVTGPIVASPVTSVVSTYDGTPPV